MTTPSPDTAGATATTGLRATLVRYVPALAVAVALAVWVSVVPSTTPDGEVASVDIFDGSAETSDDDGRVGSGATGDQSAADGDESTGDAGPGSEASRSRSNDGQTSPADGAATSPDGGAPRQAATGDCRRTEIVSSAGCRPPAWKGTDNGGATTRGVDAETINVVAYQVRQNEQVQAILAAAGSANDANRKAAFEAIVAWINDNFELYGRKLNPIYHVGTSQANDPAGQQADAVHVAEELDAAFVVTLYPADIFSEELHRRKVPHFMWNQWSLAFHESLSPHMFGLFPDRDLTFGHLTEYVCKRLVGAPAVHAGDPVYQRTERKFGIVYQDSTDNGPFLAELLRDTCGYEVTKILSYPPDIGNAVAIATNAVTQMKEAGVTTVTCLCDVIAPVFFTQQATNQAWFPEWIHNGFFVTDANAAGRLYDQTQWSNSFGPSSLSFPKPIATDNNGFKACTAGGGEHEHCVKGSASYWATVSSIAYALEALGPKVNDVDFARTLVNLPPIERETPNDPRYSFGRQGPGPFSLLDDFMEIWWDPTGTGNDGERGTAFYVESGKRYLLGQWPSGAPNVFVDDGSEQPAVDPDLAS